MGTKLADKVHIVTIASDPLIQRLLSLMLEHPRVRISVASQCHEAITIVERGAPAAILLDTYDQFDEGLRFSHQILACPNAPILVVFVSEPSHLDAFCQSGVDAVFLKPFRVREVLGRLDELMRARYHASLPNWYITSADHL